MVFHDHIDKVINRGIFVAYKYFAVKHFVVSEDVVHHLFVNVLRWRCKTDFHPSCLLRFEIDISAL
jgi:hypothetical protein